MGRDGGPERTGPVAPPARPLAELHAGGAGGRRHRRRAPGARLRRRRRRAARPHGRAGVQRRPGPRPRGLRAAGAPGARAGRRRASRTATSSRSTPAQPSATFRSWASAAGCRPSTSPAAARCTSTCRISPRSRIARITTPSCPPTPSRSHRARSCIASPAIRRSPSTRSTTRPPTASARGLEVAARALDGTVEALWDPAARFVLGVQWHPEVLTHLPAQAAFFTALVAAASGAAAPSPWPPESGPAAMSRGPPACLYLRGRAVERIGGTMSLPQIVDREEWVAARKALLAKEKALTRQRDALNAERRSLPMVEIDEGVRLRGPGRRGRAARPVRGPAPAHRRALHVRPGVGGRLPELLGGRRRDVGGAAAPPAHARHDARLRRPARRSPSSSAGRRARAGRSPGTRRTGATSTTTSTSRSTSRWRRSSTTSGRREEYAAGRAGAAAGARRVSRHELLPARRTTVCSTRTRPSRAARR